MYLFIQTHRSSVGGNAISMKAMDTNTFIERYKDFVRQFGNHDIRIASLNEGTGVVCLTHSS